MLKKPIVLIPMAGAGSRFVKAGYTFPKPLIPINNKPMIQIVVENLNIDGDYIFIVQKEHYEKYDLDYILNKIKPGCVIIQVDGLTEGAACSTLLAKEYIDNEKPLIIANADQYLVWDSRDFFYKMEIENLDGGIITFTDFDEKWSFAKVDDLGYVIEVAEKRQISTNASVGVYYWKQGLEYVNYCLKMINDNKRINNEFYVMPTYQEAIDDNKKIKIYHLDEFYGLGIPDDLKYFLKKNEERKFLD